MNTWQLAIDIILSVMVVGGFGIAFYFWTYMKDDKEEKNQIWNLMAHKYDYRAYGDVIDVKDGPFGRKKITYLPKDYSLKDVMDNVKYKPVNVFTNKSHELPFSKGRLSKGKNITLILPNKASELSEEWRQTFLGRWLAVGIELQNADNTVIQALHKGMEAQASHVKDIRGGEASIELMKMMQEAFTDTTKTIMEAKKDKAPSLFDNSSRMPGTSG